MIHCAGSHQAEPSTIIIKQPIENTQSFIYGFAVSTFIHSSKHSRVSRFNAAHCLLACRTGRRSNPPVPVVCGPGCRRSQWVPPPDLNWTWCVLLLPGCCWARFCSLSLCRRPKTLGRRCDERRRRRKNPHTLRVQKLCWRVLVRSRTENSSSLSFSHFHSFHLFTLTHPLVDQYMVRWP